MFSRSLKGVPLAYDNIRILGQYGDIINDSGYIHMDILADFIVFQPKKGQRLLVRLSFIVRFSFVAVQLENLESYRAEEQKYVCQINKIDAVQIKKMAFHQ